MNENIDIEDISFRPFSVELQWEETSSDGFTSFYEGQTEIEGFEVVTQDSYYIVFDVSVTAEVCTSFSVVYQEPTKDILDVNVYIRDIRVYNKDNEFVALTTEQLSELESILAEAVEENIV